MSCSSRICFLIFLATLVVAATTKTSSVYNNNNNLSTDKASLVAFKSYVTSDPRNILKNGWSDSTFICNWTGVTCGNDPLRVVGLDLSYAGLVGTVPPHLGNLTSLVVLLLPNNSFHGLLPTELSRLSQLNNLSFGFNDLTGEIPRWIGSLPKLQRLWLNNNQFLGSLPISIFNLTSLQIVGLSFNKLSGSIPAVAAVSNATSLKILDISDNHLTGNIPPWIGSLPKLQELWLYGNRFVGSIPIAIFNLTSLQIVDLSNNKLSGSIPAEVSNTTSLKILDISDNLLTGNIPPEIGRLPYLDFFQASTNALEGPFPQFVFNISSLKVLALSGNSFYATSLPDNICQHIPNIEKLYLAQNNISGQIPWKLLECKQLQELNLWGNNFQGHMPKSIANLTSAKEINLSRNKLTGTIPEDIGNLNNLEILNLGSNNIIGTIPPTLFNITTIKAIDLHSNQLSGGLPLNFGLGVPNLERLYLHTNNLSGSLPESISNASKLTRLDIGNNHFSGFIPNTLRALNKLEFLNLFNNNLTLIESANNILHTIASFSHLKLLDMSFNPLSTRLPSSLGSNISNSLEKLSFYNCSLRGHIPASTFANFSSLILLGLGENQFSGSIPPSIGMLKKLQGLSLSTNLLDGPIPLQLCQLQFMSHLYLDNNMFYGAIPGCLGHITSLRTLNLGSNNFSSAIPSTIWGITDIMKVDLSSNSLTGSLSIDIGKLKALTHFNVSGNQLSGNISSSILNLQSLESLDLGSNNFQGSIPDSMGNLLSLKHLDLSNNTLSGVIPKSMERLSFLTFLNLSYNKLYGEIPSRGCFSNFSSQSFIHNENLCSELMLQAPPCKSAPRKPNMAYVIPSVIVAVILCITTLIIIAFCRKKSRKLDSEVALVTLRRVSPFELSTATNGFKDENLLGVGGFGSVFKGTLSDGLVVAIKVFNLQLEQAFGSFASECQVLCNIRHRNLVKIITCCSSPDFKALVLQYMPHGSLDKWLYSDGAFLNLLQRLNIMIDVASALEYLHYGHSTPIVHCDLKPSNVLLDENMVAHVSDFGISRVLRGDNSMTQTMTLATIGYMAPEYGVGGVVSRRGDVYSFGIMLMEVFTKKKPVDNVFCQEMNLKQWVQNSIQNKAIDSDLLSAEDRVCNNECVTSVLELALACSASSPQDRIDVKIAISELNKIKNKFITHV